MSPASTRSGYLHGVAALTAWGFLPIYWKQLADIPSLEVIGHRAAWSVVFLLLVCALRGSGTELVTVLRSVKKIRTLAVSGGLIASNWLVYVWGVNHGQLLEASLGYFLSPLVMIALGAFLLQEQLSTRRKCAVGLATTGVLLKAISAGTVPWLGLYLALSMSLYGYLRKKLDVGSLVGLAVETLILSPLAIAYILYLSFTNSSHFLSEDQITTGLLLMTGVCTSLPLMWFVRAGQLLPLSTLGILQYLSPTLQFLLAVGFYDEPMTAGALASFALIWMAIGLYVKSEEVKKTAPARSSLSASRTLPTKEIGS